jgi:4-hydroxy-2-oxovalerate aldolase
MNPTTLQPEILEVTLRDGSYLVDFQFTADDTTLIASALDSAGFRWIEVGHGLGLGATALGRGAAACSDVEYMQAAAEAVQLGRWGMFFIPGIGQAEDLRVAAAHNMGFVRIGTNTADVGTARPFIELAKNLGITVSYNAMKSYAVSPEEFARCCRLARNWGADIVCLVDSAGGMYPEDVAAYLTAAKDACDARLGFHAHDNLALAMANTIRALDCGATLVDSSLQGIGRSAGNTISEVLVAIMQRRGLLPGFDLNTVTDLGQALIQPALRRRGMDPMAVISGAARFHSSFTPKLQQYARKYGVDVRDLIVRLCEHDQLNAPDRLLEDLSREIASQRLPRIVTVRTFSGGWQKTYDSLETLRSTLREIRSSSIKAGKFAALNIILGEKCHAGYQVSGHVHVSAAHVIGSVTVTSDAQLRTVLTAVEGQADVVLLDIDRKDFLSPHAASLARQLLEKSLLLTYSDSSVWVQAVEDQAARILDEDLNAVPVVIAGGHSKAVQLGQRLADRGCHVTFLVHPEPNSLDPFTSSRAAESRAPLIDRPGCAVLGSPHAEQILQHAQMVISWLDRKTSLTQLEIRHVRPKSWLLDASIGGISPDGLDLARQKQVFSVRVNIWPALAAALMAAHDSARICRDALGWDTIASIPVVAGGAIGSYGDVIVDHVRDPTRVIGVADGRGGVIFGPTPEFAQRLKTVTEEIHRIAIRRAIDEPDGLTTLERTQRRTRS